MRPDPDIFEAIAVAVVPYVHSSHWFYMPVRLLSWIVPTFNYQLYFQDHTAQAAAELNKDIRRSIRAVYRTPESHTPEGSLRSKTDFLGVWNNTEIPPSPLLSPEEEDYLVQQYSIQGFNYSFYTYGNRYGSWKFIHDHGNYTIPQPALAIYPTLDGVADWLKVERLLGSAKYVPNLTRATIPAAHWVQLEKPAEFNAALRQWLNLLPGNEAKEGSTQQHRADEL